MARRRHWASQRGLSLGQWLFWAGLAALIAWGVVLEPRRTGLVLIVGVQLGFIAMGGWRILLTVASRRRPPAAPPPPVWPRYTVLAALHDEAVVIPQLVRRLAAIDYPPDRLQGLLLLEAHDASTITAALNADRPDWLEVVIVSDGAPRTKPRALNYGLARATGDLVTIYDAEDQPHPQQLREAAARFAADRSGRLGCLQAPLRIRPPQGTRFSERFLARQFAVEYAALFEVTLPAMAQLGLPFPLGGTSNHFRAEALREVGGWDAWNVTEDADLGFSLWRAGWKLHIIGRPTWEAAPERLYDWLPQRTRWLKGFMQTWGVHTRDLWSLGLRGALALSLSIGGALTAAASHAAAITGVAAVVLVALVAGLPPQTSFMALGVLAFGVISAWINGLIGARRAGVPYGPVDMLLAPGAWALLSLAFLHAAHRLVTEPFTWDKTAHRPDTVDLTPVEPASNDNGLRIESVSL
ncbi:MAG: glycosyltransferase family 2 protein [Brevundimonas sp.]|uniref:glycosyltransferase family 2 protein n=1 Tax=Brevundimonas sp. TaxID=1871086 RepID=UPI0040335223